MKKSLPVLPKVLDVFSCLVSSVNWKSHVGLQGYCEKRMVLPRKFCVLWEMVVQLLPGSPPHPPLQLNLLQYVLCQLPDAIFPFLLL